MARYALRNPKTDEVEGYLGSWCDLLKDVRWAQRRLAKQCEEEGMDLAFTEVVEVDPQWNVVRVVEVWTP